MRLFLLEDEYSLALSIKEFLEEFDYEVVVCDNSTDALNKIYEENFDLLLFDINVYGDMNGIELLRVIREEYNIKTPTMFITAQSDIDSVKEAYKFGCCDYIRKPFDMIELELRIKQTIKSKCFLSDEEVIDLGLGYLFNTKTFTILKENEELQLNKTEKNILELLVKNRDKFLPVEVIKEIIWGEKDIDIANIRVQINNLRKKIDGELIVNIRGLGYKIENK